MKWGHPEILWGLAALLPAAWLVLALLRRRERKLTVLADAALLPVLLPARNPARMRRRALCWLAAAGLACAAAARPQWGFHWEDVQRRGLDILVLLDTSNSMLAADLKPNRLQQAKWGLRDFVKKIEGDRIGLIAFAGGSFLQCPLTIDYAAFMLTLDDVYAGLIPRGGTDIAQALQKAAETFDYRTGADPVIVIITDGEAHEGDAATTAALLRDKGIRVYAVGVGTPEGDLIPMEDRNGAARFLKDKDNQVIKTALREDVLEQLALETGGAYVRSAPGDFGLERLYADGIARLQRAELENRRSRIYDERYGWFLGAALLLLLVEAVLADGRPAVRSKEAAA